MTDIEKSVLEDERAERQWAKEEQEDYCPALTEYRRKCREYGGREI